MATTYRTLTGEDVIQSRTRLHEYIPITGSILSGSIYGTRNVKTFSHGLYESIYDYPHISSSANHIMDISFGKYTGSVTHAVGDEDKGRIYQIYSQLLMGFHHQTSSLTNLRAKQNYGIQFDQDGNLAAGGVKLNECYFVNFSRLLVKDEIKKGTFNMTMGIGRDYKNPFTSSVTIRDFATNDKGRSVSYNAANQYRTNATVGEYGFLYMTGSDDSPSTGISDGFTTPIVLRSKRATNNLDETTARSVAITTLAAGPTGLKVTFSNTVASVNIEIVPKDSPSTSLTTAELVELINNGSVVGKSVTLVDNSNLRQTLSATGGGAQNLANGTADDDDTIALNPVKGLVDRVLPGSQGAAGTANAEGLNFPVGLIFYQPGILVLTSSIFNDNLLDDTKIPYEILELTSSITNTNFGKKTAIRNASIQDLARGFRNRIRNITFNNTVELNSTIYMCRASLGDYNYSSNPTYINGSKIVVKNERSDQPVSYLTSIGMYSSDNELLAVAKTSEPLRKDPSNELTLRVRLDY